MVGVARTWMPLESICNTGSEINELQSHPSSESSLELSFDQ